MRASKMWMFGMVLAALVGNTGCARLPSPVTTKRPLAQEPPLAGTDSVALASESDAAPRGSVTGNTPLTTEKTADLSPASEPRVWLEAISKELVGTRTALLVVSTVKPVTFITLSMSFDPGQAEIRWVEFDSRVAPNAREVESSPGWKRYQIELSRPIQGQVTLGQLGYVASGAAATTAAPPVGVKIEARPLEESGIAG